MSDLDSFSKVAVLVVGDVMLDRYWWGSVNRISPEAPVPVVRMTSTSVAAGGAANVAANIAGLGAKPFLVGAVGDDAEGHLLPGVLEDAGVDGDHLIVLSERQTTVKTRLVAHGQQIVRVDHECDDDLSSQDKVVVCERVSALIGQCNVVVVSDYAKGLLTDSLLSFVISTARGLGKPVLVDPKGKKYEKYRGATVLTPNRREALDACGSDDESNTGVDAAGQELMTKLSLDAVLITRGEDGMTLFRLGEDPYHQPARARQVYDVTGAGDTVIATLAVALGSGMDLVDAANISNLAASLVVEKVGTTPVTAVELAAVMLDPDGRTHTQNA